MPLPVEEVHFTKGKKAFLEIRGTKIYLRTSEQSPFSVYIDCGDSLYSYLINPKDIPSQHIKLVDRSLTRVKEKEKLVKDRFSVIRSMMASMIGSSPFSGRIIQCNSRDAVRGKDIEGRCESIWEGIASGVIYKIKNITKRPVRIFEEDFWTPEVLAVALEKEILGPGEETSVYIVKVNHTKGVLPR